MSDTMKIPFGNPKRKRGTIDNVTSLANASGYLSDRRHFLKFGAALPLALHSLDLRAATTPKPAAPPKRIMFICNSLGFYEPYFFPKTRGDLSSSKYLGTVATKDKMTVFQNLFHPGMETSNHDSEKSFLTGAPKPESPSFANTISVDQVLARQIGGDTRFPFLPLSIYDRGWGCSWNNRGVAIPKLRQSCYCLNWRVVRVLFTPVVSRGRCDAGIVRWPAGSLGTN